MPTVLALGPSLSPEKERRDKSEEASLWVGAVLPLPVDPMVGGTALSRSPGLMSLQCQLTGTLCFIARCSFSGTSLSAEGPQAKTRNKTSFLHFGLMPSSLLPVPAAPTWGRWAKPATGTLQSEQVSEQFGAQGFHFALSCKFSQFVCNLLASEQVSSETDLIAGKSTAGKLRFLSSQPPRLLHHHEE